MENTLDNISPTALILAMRRPRETHFGGPVRLDLHNSHITNPLLQLRTGSGGDSGVSPRRFYLFIAPFAQLCLIKRSQDVGMIHVLSTEW